MHFVVAVLLAAGVLGGPVQIEAEDGVLEGPVVATTRAGYGGTGYVTGFGAATDSLRLRFTTGKGVYAVVLRVQQTSRIRSYGLRLDGRALTGTATATGAAFADRKLAEVWLAEGEHTLVVGGGTSVVDLDAVRLEPVVYDPPARPTSELSNPHASATTRALYAYLVDLYGRRILSSQQDMNEIQYIQATTGKVPAIGSFDLIEYSPSRIQYGSNPGRSVENWINWAGRDALVSLAWHWNAPTDLINQAPDKLWWSGFYTRATTFDFKAALDDTTSERYRLLLRDIDAIAAQLKKFQAADVPVLWRPLHEAAGGWFWWGSKGPEAFVRLWRLLYDRLTRHHGLDNLIWVYTHEPNAFAWYPGDDVVDIVSRDVYASDPHAIMLGDWQQLQQYYGPRKLVTLSESGTLPDPEVITDYGIWWSWFSLWNGQFIRGVDKDRLRRAFTSELVVTRDELADWRNFGTAVDDPALLAGAPPVALYPNPTGARATVRLTLPAAAEVRVEVFDVAGRRVRRYDHGFQPAGPFEADVEAGEAAGVYLVRVVAGGVLAQRTLVVTH